MENVSNQIVLCTMVSNLKCNVCYSVIVLVSYNYVLFLSVVKRVITDVSFSPANRALIIQSRDCIASPEDYSVVVHYINAQNGVEQTSLNVSFNTTVVIGLGDELVRNTLYSFSARIFERKSSVVVDEMSITVKTPQYPDGPGNYGST